MTTAAALFLGASAAVALTAALARLLSQHGARAALTSGATFRWSVACSLSPLLRSGALGVLLAGIVVLFQATTALRSDADKNIVVPVMIAVLAAAVYDQLIHLRDLYWEAIDASLDRVLNPVDGAVVPRTDQRVQFNRTHLDLLEGPARYRREALQLILAPEIAPVAELPPVAPSEGGNMPGTFEENDKQLLELAIKDYEKLKGDEGPISGNTLDVTKTGGLAAVFGGVAAGVGTLFAATKGAPASVVIATLAVAAVAILALALIVRSDHTARATVTVDMIRVVPKLIAVAHASGQQPAAAGGGGSGLPVHIAAIAPANGSAPASPVIPVDMSVTFANDADPSRVIAVKLADQVELYAFRPGAHRFDWVPENEVAAID